MSTDWLFCAGEQTQVWFGDNPTLSVQTPSRSGCFQLGKFQVSEVNLASWEPRAPLPEFVHSLPGGPAFCFFFFKGKWSPPAPGILLNMLNSASFYSFFHLTDTYQVSICTQVCRNPVGMILVIKIQPESLHPVIPPTLFWWAWFSQSAFFLLFRQNCHPQLRACNTHVY